MITANAGSIVTLEATLKEYTPFGDYVLADPDSAPTITITDKNGDVVVTAAVMTKSSVGLYYYHVQTQTTWLKDIFKSQVNATFSTMNDVKIDVESFILE